MMKIIQILFIATATTVTGIRGNPEGRIPLTHSTKTVFPETPKVAFGSYQTFGTSFVPGSSASPAILIPPTIQSFSQTGSFVQTGEGYPRTGNSFPVASQKLAQNAGNTPKPGFPESNDNVPPVGENFLRINQNSRESFSQRGHGFSKKGPSVSHNEQHFSQRGPSFSPGGQSFLQKGYFFEGGQNVGKADRRQGIPATAPVSFGTPTNSVEEILEQEWDTFKNTFNKTYSSFEEERQRREIFIENRNKVSRFNQEYGNGRHSFVQKLNQYADLLNHEFNGQVNGLNRTRRDGDQPERRPSAFISSANVQLPSYIDWREAGAVTPVRSQEKCGACYAFAAAGALEGQNYRRTGRLIELSPQNLIDCTQSYTNSGCIGGLMEYAFEYVRDNRGLDTENSYPFEARDGQECRYRQDGYGAHATGYVILDEGDEAGLETAIATLGPVAIGIDAHSDSFQFYSNGIYFEPLCSSSIDNVNHAVLVVGYGTEPNGQQYWLIKNSYGPEWGIGGYMKLAKFANNHCAVASYATYPLV